MIPGALHGSTVQGFRIYLEHLEVRRVPNFDAELTRNPNSDLPNFKIMHKLRAMMVRTRSSRARVHVLLRTVLHVYSSLALTLGLARSSAVYLL